MRFPMTAQRLATRMRELLVLLGLATIKGFCFALVYAL